MRDFYVHGIITDPVVMKHPTRPPNPDWYPRNTPTVSGRGCRGWGRGLEVINRSQVLIAFETFFDWSVIEHCRRRGVKTALMPMYEWHPAHTKYKPDLYLNPSLLDQDFFPDGVFVPVPVETKHWRLRTRANHFVHNAGNVGCKEHKGTRQLLEAVKYVQHSGFRLTVRAQDSRILKSIVADTGADRDPRVTIQYGEIPYAQLWAEGDVLIAPEKQNGLSLPLQEGFAAGMAVMTTDRYPTNTWLPKDPLIPVARYERASNGGCLEYDLAVVEPETIAATIDAWVGRDITALSEAGRDWAAANSWEALKPHYVEILENLVGK